MNHIELIWGTAVTITVPEDPRWTTETRWRMSDLFDQQVAIAVEYMNLVDQVFSTYWEDSLVTAYRTDPSLELRLDRTNSSHAMLQDVIEACRYGRTLTNGAFDPWAVPGGFDPSGYVKGWAAQNMAEQFVAAGLINVCVNAGGDVVVRGDAEPNMPGTGWLLGLQNPDDRATIIGDVRVNHGAVSTSGTYERGNHIINPTTGEPATDVRSATVVGLDGGVCEILSTALVIDPDLSVEVDGYDLSYYR